MENGLSMSVADQLDAGHFFSAEELSGFFTATP
jgi:hypothetical protein